MTFELSPQHAAVRDKARAFAQQMATRATEIDQAASLPADATRDVATLTAGDSLAMVIALEEIAVASAALATSAAATRPGAGPLAMTGLRGASDLDTSPRTQLVLATVALGIGRAATEASLAELRRSKSTSGADVEKPHWVVADVATELDAARLMTYKAAQTTNESEIAMARLMAVAAAARAVDAAVRVIGPAALTEGSVVERLARDVRAVAVLGGTEEEQRATIAEGLLPH